jgi:hypothetical protein
MPTLAKLITTASLCTCVPPTAGIIRTVITIFYFFYLCTLYCRVLGTGSFRLRVEVDGEALDSGPLGLSVVPPVYGDLVSGATCVW